MRSPSKYYAKKVTHNGVTYDSKKECQRHTELLLLERAGVIRDLRRQVKFELIPSQKVAGKVVERACGYVADFVYTKDGKTHVEDVKGYRGGGAYTVFTIKRKLMLYIHNIIVEEI